MIKQENTEFTKDCRKAKITPMKSTLVKEVKGNKRHFYSSSIKEHSVKEKSRTQLNEERNKLKNYFNITDLYSFSI